MAGLSGAGARGGRASDLCEPRTNATDPRETEARPARRAA